LVKGVSLAAFGLWVLGSTVHEAFAPDNPRVFVMGTVGLLAFGANVISVLILFRFRDGDANVRSVWLCSRNDALGNLAVVVAAGSVWAADSGWPDLVVAAVLAGLFLSSAYQIIRDARRELQVAATVDAAAE
jgi:Co/Zn/Cd efflux system component